MVIQTGEKKLIFIGVHSSCQSKEAHLPQAPHFESLFGHRAREYSYHFSRDGRSTGLSFHWRSGSWIRASKRRLCSLLLTSSQYLIM